jgi:4-hydroxybenzoate polyprenyltransferase
MRTKKEEKPVNSSQEPTKMRADSTLIAAIQALRPKQWVKNILLFAALIFSLNFENPDMWLRTLMAFGAFCLLSSTGYIFNDIRDREADRLHPKKSKRPIAAGRLSVGAAQALMVVSFLGGCSLAYAVGQLSMDSGLESTGATPWFLFVALLYFATTLSYSLIFKNIVILDVMFIAAGFVWRAAAGAVAIQVQISAWLLVCTVFLSLFLGFNKRRGELSLMRDQAANTRKILTEYNAGLLLQIQGITTSGTIISYALYAVLGSPFLPEQPWLLLTLPHVLYGVFRYMYLVEVKGEGGAPDETLLRDKPLLMTCAFYGLSVVAILALAPASAFTG